MAKKLVDRLRRREKITRVFNVRRLGRPRASSELLRLQNAQREHRNT
jgi:hypothetical protein